MRLICIGLLCAALPLHAAERDPPKAAYRDSSLPVEIRVQDLLSRMTLQEKLAQMRMTSLYEVISAHKTADRATLAAVLPAEGIGALDFDAIDAETTVRWVTAAQSHLRTQTRLGIPALIYTEALHGAVNHGATIFPQAIGMASTWNPALIEKMAAAAADEAYAIGIRQAASPVLDLAREPRWGRVEETYGEDPFLVSRMGLAFVRGLQGQGPALQPGHIAATLKHFAAHGSPLGGLNVASVAGGERDLRTLYLPPFEMAIRDGGALSLMSAYNSYEGVPVAASRRLLTDILRGEWGFQGYVVSDYGAIGMLQEYHHTAATLADAARQALGAGVDLEAPENEAYSQLPPLLAAGRIDQQQIDTAVARILRVKFLSGAFDRPLPGAHGATRLHGAAHVRLAHEIAAESIVLLKNQGDLLPLKKNLKSIAVIGPNADQVQFGDYSYSEDNRHGVTVLQGIKRSVASTTSVRYAKGCGIYERSTQGFDEAVRAARDSEVAIVVVGDMSLPQRTQEKIATSGESFDVSSLDLPGVQSELVQAVVATGTPTVVVLVQGRPHAIAWMKERVPAIIDAWYPGEQGGSAIADVLFGVVNPSGRLPVSIAADVGHLPVYYNYYPTDRGVYHHPGTPEQPGTDYVFSSPAPLYAFGHGLSYTRFDYSALRITPAKAKAANTIDVALDVRNAGKRDGKETVQLYVRRQAASVVTPVMELKGFAKVEIRAGASQTIHIALPITEFAIYDEQMHRRIEPGVVELMVGAASDDIRQRATIEIEP